MISITSAYTLPKTKKSQKKSTTDAHAETDATQAKKDLDNSTNTTHAQSNATTDTQQNNAQNTTPQADKNDSTRESVEQELSDSPKKNQSESSASSVDYQKLTATIQIQCISETRKKLSNLLILINNNQAKSLENKKETVFYLNYLIKEIEHLQTNKFNGKNPQDVCFGLLQINEAILEHISQSLSDGFHSIPLLPLSDLLTESSQKRAATKAPFSLKALLQNNNKLTQKLSYQIDNIGLHIGHHIYRAFDDALVDPIITNEVIPNTAMIAAAGASIYCLLKHPDKAMAITSFVGWHGDRIAKKWHNSIEPYIAKKVAVTRNRLKGGAYNSIADHLDGSADKTTFKDLIGLEDEIEKFQLMVNYIANPELCNQLGFVPAKGYLLIGPPRTGKTLLVKAVRTQMALVCKAEKLNFFIIKSSEIYKKGGISKIFAEAKAAAPCVLFFDEFDLLNLQRGVGNTNTLEEFLTSMDGVTEDKDPKKLVITIAATNRPETLDGALIQPGRFSEQIRFKLPTLELRKETVKRKLEKFGLSLGSADETSSAINEIALETEGSSYEALNRLVGEAYMYASISSEIFEKKHLKKALDESIRNIRPHQHEHLPVHEQRLIATHFAGQALTLTLIDSLTKLAQVTTLPHMPHLKEESLLKLTFGDKETRNVEQDRYTYGAVFTYKENDTAGVIPKDELINQCKMHVAGIVAEEIILGSASYTCNRDAMDKAMQIAKAISFEGMKEDSVPKAERLKRFKNAEMLVENCKKEVRTLLTTHKDKLSLLINTLQEKKQLNRDEVLALLQ